MRSTVKRCLLILILFASLFNLYILTNIYFNRTSLSSSTSATFILKSFQQRPTEQEKEENQRVNVKNALNENEFIILDWTGKEHIFREEDSISCDFSSISDSYCITKFSNLSSSRLSQRLIARCQKLKSLKVRWTDDQSRLSIADLISYHSIHLPSSQLPELVRTNDRQQYSMVYVLESEVHSSGGSDWHEIDFPMWYNLNRSYPEPATYFDLNSYLTDLFRPVKVEFEKKNSVPLVWIISNCNAYNGRQYFIRDLMHYIKVDSYGSCLNNIHSDDAQNRQKGNHELYSKYKFVISIENSNCEDYVTEKLIDAISSTSIPIVASRSNIPNYDRFLPTKSYINIYDYQSTEEFAMYLNYLANNKTAHDEYLWFRAKKKEQLPQTGNLTANILYAENILGTNSTMRRWLIEKERSINKYCKVVEYIHTTYWSLIYKRRRYNRPLVDDICLPSNDIQTYFQKKTNSNNAK